MLKLTVKATNHGWYVLDLSAMKQVGPSFPTKAAAIDYMKDLKKSATAN